MIRSIADLLQIAKQPLGSTMYVWGGGWNEEDSGAGWEARTLGVSPWWKMFADRQTSQYDFRKTRFQIHDGLDCSGYVGWVIYNVFEFVSGRAGYVIPAGNMAWEFAVRGWGTYTPAEQVSDWKAGDIMSMKGHVWISLGMCEDGSVVMLHASPPGVMLNGTTGHAAILAECYMQKYYPLWYARYPVCCRDNSYLEKSAQLRWYRSILTDSENLTEKYAEEVLAFLFTKEDCRFRGFLL